MDRVKDHSELGRDPNSKAVLVRSTPTTRLAIEQNRRERMQAQRIDKLEKDVSSILSVMNKILEKLDG